MKIALVFFLLTTSICASAADKAAPPAPEPTMADSYKKTKQAFENMTPEQRTQAFQVMQEIQSEMEDMPEADKQKYFEDAKKRIPNLNQDELGGYKRKSTGELSAEEKAELIKAVSGQ